MTFPRTSLNAVNPSNSAVTPDLGPYCAATAPENRPRAC